ncbi:phenylalanine--tRNA ligase subunit alpha [Candidatus Woesearchaeota archaeon]|nr:phenylalanine--tRNA ligase subunit alpha [Candidatus Woesearchaeota archaeon]
MDAKKLAQNLHILERKVLPNITDGIDLRLLADNSGISDVEAMRAIQWLSNKGAVSISEKEKDVVQLGTNGVKYRENGLPERRFLEAIDKKEMTLSQIAEKSSLDREEINVCIGILRSKAAIEIRKEKEPFFRISENGKKIIGKKSLEEAFLEKEFPMDASGIAPEEKFALEQLAKRKDIISLSREKIKSISLTDFGKELKGVKVTIQTEDRLTPSLLRAGQWKGKTFREYDVGINVPKVSGGKRHFVSQAVDYIKSIWIDMGFKEMTGSMVQLSFWDLDCLFVPQDHPARQMQDTFYLKEPKVGKLPLFWKKIKDVHETGSSTGSKGWGKGWSEELAKENLLRTHTTVLSAHALSRIKKSDMPCKLFSVGKVFRNEAIDYKHLFEFYQVEGIVVDKDLNFTNLKGYLREFFTKMGYSDVRIRPAHFPYTYCSCEVEVLHPKRKEWIELGGAGIFRPELTSPLLGEEVPVLAWGLGLDRIISEYWNISDIRQLYGNDLRQTKEMKFWVR